MLEKVAAEQQERRHRLPWVGAVGSRIIENVSFRRGGSVTGIAVPKGRKIQAFPSRDKCRIR
jgi:hypothetical protein